MEAHLWEDYMEATFWRAVTVAMTRDEEAYGLGIDDIMESMGPEHAVIPLRRIIHKMFLEVHLGVSVIPSSWDRAACPNSSYVSIRWKTLEEIILLQLVFSGPTRASAQLCP